MTTNRMGLTPEMALEISNERIDDEALAELIEFRRGSLGYHVKQGNKTQAFMHGMVLSALRELLAYREASKQTVAYIDELELNRIKDGDSGVIRTPIYGAGYQDASIPLYAAPPLQAVTVPDDPTDDERLMEIEGVSVVKLPTEFHSEHGVVVQLEKVMAALAVHGIKYERRHQKVVGLRAGIDAIRAEGIDIDA